MPLRVVYNHRSAHRAMTGVERYASELLRELRVLADVTEVVGPSGVVRGQLHEQFVLPLRAGRSFLVSPGNAGPVVARRHLLVVHDLAPLRVPESFSPRYRRYVGAALSMHRLAGTTIATVSQASRDDLAAWLDRDPAEIPVVPNGVRVPMLRDEPAGEAGADAVFDAVFMVHLGTVQPRKRVDLLTAVWPEVFRRTGVRLVLVGDRGAAGVYGASHASDTSAGVEWRGRVSDDEVARLMAASSGLISLSAFEGFGLPVLEALAMGRPVVASDIPPHRELAAGRSVTLLDVGAGGDRVWVDELVAAVAAAVEPTSIARAQADADAVRRAWSWQRSAQALVDALAVHVDR